jgi:hypothetical protein
MAKLVNVAVSEAVVAILESSSLSSGTTPINEKDYVLSRFLFLSQLLRKSTDELHYTTCRFYRLVLK